MPKQSENPLAQPAPDPDEPTWPEIENLMDIEQDYGGYLRRFRLFAAAFPQIEKLGALIAKLRRRYHKQHSGDV